VKFSIVIPTQDRARLLSVAVAHAMRLEHPDFEVIVSDNSTTDEKHEMNLAAVREHLGAPNFRVVRPPRVLSIPEHFEFALPHATGDYVTYLTDKMVVFPHTLSTVDAVIRESGADIVNWVCAEYFLDDPESPLGSGTLVEELEFLDGRPTPYDPLAALRLKASCSVPREKQARREFVLGKLVFGCYSRRLIDEIRSGSGTVFGGATHDYSAMVQALSLARTCVMLNAYVALFFSLPRAQSSGSATATEPQRALEYYRAFTDPDAILSSLLVPGVYASQHNMVAHDYKKFLALYGNERFFSERNWLRAIAIDLVSDWMIWRDPDEKAAQLALFRRHVKRPGHLLAAKATVRLAEARARAIQTRDRVLDRHPPATSEAFSAASLEQAMAHALSDGRERRQPAADADGALRLGLLDAPVKVLMTVVLALRTPALRGVLWRTLAAAVVHPATRSALPAVLEDLLKLAIVCRIRAGKLPRLSGDVAVTVQHSPGEVLLRSRPAGDAVEESGSGSPGGAALRRVTWDHSAVGSDVRLRRVTWDHSAVGSDIRLPLALGRDIRVSIGEPGRHVHEFRSLPGLAERFPAQVARALP
jgi:glycosyltransferase involved in cell wall biosynthesis